jgi:hypothetical protein
MEINPRALLWRKKDRERREIYKLEKEDAEENSIRNQLRR